MLITGMFTMSSESKKKRGEAEKKGFVRLPELWVWPSHKAKILAYIERLIARGER